MFTLAISLFDHFQFTLIHRPDIPGSYAILFFIASNLTSITSHIHNWALFLLWLSLFILFGVISPLFPSSILDTYQPGALLFWCHIFSPFHTVHGCLKARILQIPRCDYNLYTSACLILLYFFHYSIYYLVCYG